MDLTSLPPEILEKIIQNLEAPDICRVRLACSALRDVCDQNSVWSLRSAVDFSINLTPEAPAREIYQLLLYKYSFSIGLWQRLDLQYYGEAIKVVFDGSRSLVFYQLLPSNAGVETLRFLSISLIQNTNEVQIENWRALTGDGAADVTKELDSGTVMNINIEKSSDNGKGRSGYFDVLRSFNSMHPGLFVEYRKAKIESALGFNYRFQPLMTESWIEEYHGRFSSNSSILESVKPGVFRGLYGSHGWEMIHFKNGQGVKITGDPNIPFNKVTFRITNSGRIDLPTEIQEDMGELEHATECYEEYLVEDEEVSCEVDMS